jgi:integrase
VAEPIHQLPTSRWEVRYRDPQGKPRRYRFATQKQARDHLADIRIAGRSGTYTAPELGRVTLAEWVDEWTGTTVHLRSTTRARYERDIRLHILPRFGVVRIAKLSPRDVRAWIAEMLAAGEAQSAVRRRFSVFRKIMNDAVAMEMIGRSPCRGVVPPADTRGDIRVLTADEVTELADAMPVWCRTWVWVAAYTGIRWSEMLGLRRSDIDLLRRTLTVRRQIVEVNGRFEGFGEPKTAAGRRTIDLPAFLCEMLVEQLATRAQPGADGLVFVNTRGKPPHTSSFASHTWSRARAAVGRPDLRWHDLRHTAVALAIANGAHPKAIQERMGHSSITVTLDRYGHLFPSLGQEIANGLDATFRSAAPPRRASVTELAGSAGSDAFDAAMTRKRGIFRSPAGTDGQQEMHAELG